MIVFFVRFVLLVFIVSIARMAHGEPASPPNIDWFAAHPKERGEVLQECNSTHRYAHEVVCHDAATGGLKSLAVKRRAEMTRAFGVIDYDTNPTARWLKVSACNHGFATGRECIAARQAEAKSASSRR